MADRSTFFIIDRCIFESWIWNEKPFDHLHAWIYIIGKANYADNKRFYKGKLQEVKRGQLVTSYKKLSEDFGWSVNRVRRFISILVDDGMITSNSTALGTTLTVKNYGKFQNVQHTDGYADGHTDGYADGHTDGYADGHTDGTHKNKGNKGNKGNNTLSYERPTREEVCAYASSFCLGVDVDDFYGYMEESDWRDSEGNPIRSWRSMLRKWKNNPNSATYKPQLRPIDVMLAKAKAEEAKQKEAEQSDNDGSNDPGGVVTE